MEQSIKFASELKNIAIAENLIDEISEKHNLSTEIYGNILISLIEAINNAIMHGNLMDAKKKVEFRYEVEGDFVVFHVADEGKGFNFASTPDPTTPENIERPHGRGIFLMHHLADEVKYLRNGAEVMLKFKIVHWLAMING